MPRFLHLADVHLGYDRYNCPERTKDFFLAFRDVLERYALAAEVDFVLIAGDLFEHRHILPATLNQAQTCFSMLQEHHIPVLAIEGNHDHRPYGSKTSWLRYLADWGYLILLEPSDESEADDYYLPWDEQDRRGGYIDLDCGMRVIGSRWYGAAAPQAIKVLATAIESLPSGPPLTVMMFHHGLEGQISRYAGALPYSALLPLQEAGVDYLALGHIHKNYAVEGWIFNPGSVEANSIAEGQDQNPRGVYLVEVDEQQGIQAELKRDYYQRSIVRLTLMANPQQTLEAVSDEAIALVQSQAQINRTQAAIVELRIQGEVRFNRLDLDIRALETQLHNMSEALIFSLRCDVTSTQYESSLPELEAGHQGRAAIENQVFTDFLAANIRYADRASALALGLTDLKQRLLDHQPEAELHAWTEKLLQDT